MRLRAPFVVAVLVALTLTSTSFDTTASAAPGKKIPRGLHLTASTPTSVTVAWRPVPKATAYRVVVARKRGTAAPHRIDVGSPTATIGELRPGTRYVVSVRALLGAKAKPG